MISWFARNDVAANLLVLILILGGLLTAPHVRQEVFPQFSTDRVAVTVVYPGASPDEIEHSINVRIEERIAGLEGIKKITSTAAEGAGAVTVEALPSFDPRELLNGVKAEVDAIDTFPEDAEKPIVREVVVRSHVISVAVYGQADELALKHVGERIRDDLSAIPEITQVELINARPYEVSIEVSENALRRYGLTFDAIAEAIRRSSVDLPAGSVKTDAGEILLRAKGQARVGSEFESLVLMTRPDGTRLYLSDVADVVDGFAETDQSARFNGQPSVMVEVFRVGEQSALHIADAVKGYVEKARPGMPEGIELTTWNDRTRVLRGRINTLRRNGFQGLCLVFLTLALFLQFRLAVWTVFGIPVAFLGTLWLLPALDVSINVLSLFSFILVLGIVVDDAIVIGENVFTKKQRGMSGYEAAVKGAQEVSVPVIFGVLTTVTVFVPMLFLPGVMGKIMTVFPSVVIPTLLFSLVESQMVLPSHLKHVVVRSEQTLGGIPGLWTRFQSRISGGLEDFVVRAYKPFLSRVLEWRYVVLSAAASFLLVTTALVVSGVPKLRFFPDAEADNVIADLTMPQGTPQAVTRRALDQLETAVVRLREELQQRMPEHGGKAIRHVLTSLGDQPFRSTRSSNGGRERSTFSGSHLAEVNIQLAPAESRDFSSAEVAARWRELAGPIADAVELTFSSSLFISGAPINVELAGSNVDQLREAAQRLKDELRHYPGVFDPADSFRPGKQELVLAIKPGAEALGLSLSGVAKQVRQAFYGEEAQRVQRGREDIKVMVRYPRSRRRSLMDVANMRIRTENGDEVPFSTVASVEYGRGYATIKRANRRRVVDVTADIDPNVANPNEVLASLKRTILAQLETDYPGLQYSLEGEQREQRETLGALRRGFAIALLVIFALMAVPLGSYIQPLIVMTAIPFGVAGAVWAHLSLGMDLSFLSIFGIVALVGVVVNDSLVLVDHVNRRRRKGAAIGEVICEAGVARFRPILLTSLTTFAGLAPLLLERSLQAQFLKPMAVSLGFGVLFATGVSLVIVPCSYLVLADLGSWALRLRRRSPSAIQPERSGETTRVQDAVSSGER